MKTALSVILCFLAFTTCSHSDCSQKLVEDLDTRLRSSVEIFDQNRSEVFVSPRSVRGNSVKMVKSKNWTSGFFPGELWMMYKLTQDDFWKEKAIDYTLPLADQQWNGKTHDMGFKMYCSFGKAYQNTGDEEYRDILIQSAKTLATRFNPKVGCLRSWDYKSWAFPVIIDNMMNLELLFWAAKETGNVMYKDMAISHAKVTLKNHFREDYSSYHVVDYNPETGEVIRKTTHQGYAAESAWSRGQAWGLYGYTMVYRETGDTLFLQQAEHIANFILHHPNMPEDIVPYWDFNAPNIPNEPRDASAAAIIASALVELSTYSQQGAYYQEMANKILKSLLSDDYYADPSHNHGFLLTRSTGSKPTNNEVDVPLIYADYYFVELISRMKELNHKPK